LIIHHHRYHQLFFACFALIALILIGANFYGVINISKSIAIYLLQSVLLIYSSYLYLVLRKFHLSSTKYLELYKTSPGAFILLYKNGLAEVSEEALSLLKASAPINSISALKSYINKDDIDVLKKLSTRPSKLSPEHHGEIDITSSDGAKTYIRYIAARKKLKHSPGCKVVMWLFESTKSKQQELALIKYLNKYRLFSFELNLLLDSLPLAIWRRESDLSIALRSQGYADMLNKAGCAEDIESFADVEDYMLKKLHTKSHDELIYKKKLTLAGKSTLLKFVEIPTPDVGGTVGYALEIPELSNLEDRVKTLQTTLDTMLDTFPQGILIVGSNGNVELVNRSFIKFFSIDEAILTTRISFSSLIDKMQEKGTLPETKNYKALKESYLSLLDPNSSRSIFHMHLPNNTTLRVSVTGGPSLNTIFVYDDVTHSLSTERAYKDLLLSFRTAAETSVNPMAIFGQDSRLKFHNAAFSSIFKEETSQLLASNPRFDQLLDSLSIQGDFDEMLAEFNYSMHSRQEKSYAYNALDGHGVRVLFKPLPNDTVLVRFHHLTPTQM